MNHGDPQRPTRDVPNGLWLEGLQTAAFERFFHCVVVLTSLSVGLSRACELWLWFMLECFMAPRFAGIQWCTGISVEPMKGAGLLVKSCRFWGLGSATRVQSCRMLSRVAAVF